MHLRITLAAAALSFLAAGLAPAKAPPSADLHAFFGQVTAVNLAAKTITIKLGKCFVFHVTPETRISSAAGEAVPFEKIIPGDGAFVTMRTGPGDIGIAVKILLTPGVALPSDYSARTIQGETITGTALDKYFVSKPPPAGINRGVNFGMTRSGLFLLIVQPDGTVSNAKALRSLGYEDLDVRTIQWLKKWRFRPNSLTEVRMPITYQRTR